MNKKHIDCIIPRIHSLEDCWFIQWIGNEYYINKNMIRKIFKRLFNGYAIAQLILMVITLFISGVLPVNNLSEACRAIVVSCLIGVISGFAIAEDRDFKF